MGGLAQSRVSAPRGSQESHLSCRSCSDVSLKRGSQLVKGEGQVTLDLILSHSPVLFLYVCGSLCCVSFIFLEILFSTLYLIAFPSPFRIFNYAM